MSRMVPFTVHIRVVPARPGKRFEYIRSLQKLAVLAYDGLATVANVQLALPGGGQSAQFSDIRRRGGLGDYAQGTAVKPQIGASPSQLMITGFYDAGGQNLPTYSSTQRISGGEIYTDYTQHSNNAVPTSAVDAQVKALKTAMTAALTTAFPAHTTFSIFRLDYNGIVYGNKGFHFPR